MDFVDDEQIQELMKYKCFWQTYLEKLNALKPSTTTQQPTVFSFAPPTENNNNNTTNSNAASMKELNPASLINLAMHKPQSNDFVFGQQSSSTQPSNSNDMMATEQFEQELIPITEEEKETLRHLPRKECEFYLMPMLNI